MRDIELTEMTPHTSEWKRIIKVICARKLVLIGLIIVIVLIITAILSSKLAIHDPYKVKLTERMRKPCREYPLGTDSLGRDILSRIIYGTRTSLIIGIMAIAIAATSGMTLGLIAAYFGGLTYTIIMRFIDALLSIPMILKALVITSVLGPGLVNVVIALGISMLATQARLMCGQALAIKENDYIMASKAFGVSNFNLMFRHIKPLSTLEKTTPVEQNNSLS